MNDDEPTEPMLRASAYLDGELDADEMALAEGDPAVMAEVARLRTLQGDVRRVEAPTHAAREAAIAAALAEFDVQQRPATSVVPFKPRPSYTRWLSVAAAIVVIGLLGVVIARASSSSDNDNDTAAVEQAAVGKLSSNDAAPADAATESRAAATSVPTVNAYDSAESATALAAEAAPAPTAAASAAGGAPAEASIAEQPVAPPFDSSVPIADDAELAVVGRQLLDQLAAGTLADLPQSVCNDQGASRVVLADALLIVTDTTKAVLIAGDPTTRETFALDPDTCVVIASGR